MGPIDLYLRRIIIPNHDRGLVLDLKSSMIRSLFLPEMSKSHSQVTRMSLNKDTCAPAKTAKLTHAGMCRCGI